MRPKVSRSRLIHRCQNLIEVISQEIAEIGATKEKHVLGMLSKKKLALEKLHQMLSDLESMEDDQCPTLVQIERMYGVNIRTVYEGGKNDKARSKANHR